MKVGKLDWDDLKQLIESNRGIHRNEVRIRSGIGEDCSVINYGTHECVISTDPITGADKNIGRLAVHINCNDVASAGVEPVGILVTILAPENSNLEEISHVMKEIAEETSKLNVEILGGHTEVTKAVNKMVVSCTVIGKADAGKAVSTAGAKVNDDIIITKHLCIEGTSILLNEYEYRCREVLNDKEVKEAQAYIENISVVKEGIISGKFGVNSMHDITEGGILGALWEVAEASEKGFKVYEELMPVTEITQKLCKHFEVDPLKFISSGSMLITCEKGEKLVSKLKQAGIEANIIGKITTKKGIMVYVDKSENEVNPPERDELFNI